MNGINPQLSKTVIARLDNAILNYEQTAARKGNEPISLSKVSSNKALCTTHFNELCRLKALLPYISQEGKHGLEARVLFAAEVIQSNLVHHLNTYVFFDIFDIGPREFDACFEMNDGDLVMTGLVKLGLKNDQLRTIGMQLFTSEKWLSFEEPLKYQNFSHQSENQLALV